MKVLYDRRRVFVHKIYYLSCPCAKKVLKRNEPACLFTNWHKFICYFLFCFVLCFTYSYHPLDRWLFSSFRAVVVNKWMCLWCQLYYIQIINYLTGNKTKTDRRHIFCPKKWMELYQSKDNSGTSKGRSDVLLFT